MAGCVCVWVAFHSVVCYCSVYALLVSFVNWTLSCRSDRNVILISVFDSRTCNTTLSGHKLTDGSTVPSGSL